MQRAPGAGTRPRRRTGRDHLVPEELLHTPRSTAEHRLDVRVWREEAAGGHFAAWEQPEAWAAGLRSAVALA